MRRCAAWVTEWSGKIRRNLPVKIFCFTCLLLLAVCIVTYGLIAWMMPVTYQADRNRVLSEQAESLIQELSKTTLSACGPLLEKFASDYDAQVSILDETGQPVAGTKDLAQTEEEEGRVTFSQNQTEEGMTLQINTHSPNRCDSVFFSRQSGCVSADGGRQNPRGESSNGSLGEIMALAAGLGGVGVYFGVLFLRPLCYPAIPRHGGAAGGE